MSPEEIKRKIDDIQKRYDSAVQKRAGVSGQLQAKREELAAIIQEIKTAGYDPKTLASDRDEAERVLVTKVAEYEKQLSEIETALAPFDKK
jgi:chromosome segregation ATPase